MPDAKNSVSMHIGLREARDLKEQLRPAFAGYVTDGNISERDILGTLMDLVARNKIGMEYEQQKTPIEIKRIYRTGASVGLLPFETAFIETLFADSNELSANDVKTKIYSGKLHKSISENTKSIEEFKISKSLLVSINKRGDVSKLRKYGRSLRTAEDLEGSSPNGHIISAIIGAVFALILLFGIMGLLMAMPSISIGISEIAVATWPYLVCISFLVLNRVKKDWGLVLFGNKIPKTFAILALLFLFAGFINAGGLEEPTERGFGMLSGYVLAGVLMIFISIGFVLKKINDFNVAKSALKNVHMLMDFETGIPAAKIWYEELFDFIQSFPLKEQRIYNEFMPHAIAFGLDKSWNKSFGITKEMVVKSKAVDGKSMRLIRSGVDV